MSGRETVLSSVDLALLEQLETSLWREDSRFDRALMEPIFAPDFIEFGRSGRIWSRDECLSAVRRPIGASLPLRDFVVRLIARDAALVTIISEICLADVMEYSRRSSVWSRAGGPAGRPWHLRFHQGTPIIG
jgi:hypothetical protein